LQETSILQKAFFLMLMLISNAMVWRFFVKGLHSDTNSSTIIPTVVSTASNFFISGVLGCLIFNEVTNLLWWTGAVMVVAGLYLIVSEDEDKSKEDKRE